jgi:hypothetical protein
LLSPTTPLRLNYAHLLAEGSGYGLCASIPLPSELFAGLVAPRPTRWVDRASCDSEPFPGQPTAGVFFFADKFALNDTVRRKTWDGAEYEASPMVQTRNGEPW